MRYRKIPDEAVRRLPIYLRRLLSSPQGSQQNITSQKLADLLGVDPWQIRKDFSYFGDFGTPGIGYNVERLIKQIKKNLKLNVDHKVVLVGAGNLGRAILAFPGFKIYGFDIVAVYDNDLQKIGKEVEDVTVEDVSNLTSLKKRKIDTGIIAVPRKEAQKIADTLVKADIRGILNFSPCRISVPKKVKVITIDIAMDLARLPYYIPSCEQLNRNRFW